MTLLYHINQINAAMATRRGNENLTLSINRRPHTTIHEEGLQKATDAQQGLGKMPKEDDFRNYSQTKPRIFLQSECHSLRETINKQPSLTQEQLLTKADVKQFPWTPFWCNTEKSGIMEVNEEIYKCLWVCCLGSNWEHLCSWQDLLAWRKQGAKINHLHTLNFLPWILPLHISTHISCKQLVRKELMSLNSVL